MKMTLLSAGIVLSEILTQSKEVMDIVTQVFPVAVDKATLPYVRYVRIGLASTPTKVGAMSRAAQIEVDCYAAEYGLSIALAEAVLSALDGKQYISDDGELLMRACTLVESREQFTGDAYVQTLIFNIKI